MGVDPLRIWFFEEGLTRLATCEYHNPTNQNLDNLFMHLTNYAINKESSAYVANKGSSEDHVGHKRSLTFAMEYIRNAGHDADKVMHDIKANIIKTIISVHPSLQHNYRSCQPDDQENSMCFEILGFDVMLDDKLKPWIIEVNHSPSFSTDSPIDFKIKKKLIVDVIKLLNLSYWKKLQYK
jgi:tubulin polyglutamylase TTLL6/13